MSRSNRAKARAARNDGSNKNSNNNSTEEIERSDKHNDVKKSLWGDEEDYSTGFVENRKRVARTPPETLYKRRDTKEEITNREIAETKECLDIADPVDTDGSSQEDSDDTDESDNEEAELIDEIQSIGKRLDTMTSTNAVDDAIGMDLMTTLKDLPITKNILCVTRIGRSVNQFHVCCKNKETVKLGRSLLLSWQKIVAETGKNETESKQENEHVDTVQNKDNEKIEKNNHIRQGFRS